VLDYTDALTRYFQAREQQPAPWWKKIYLKREAPCLAEYEVEISHSFDACVVSSTCDQAVLQKAGAGNNFTVVTNGVDTQVFRPALKLPKTLNVLFVGNMQYPPNAEGIQNFCRHVWPRVRARIPGAHFWVVGNPPVGTVAAWSRTFPEAEFLGRVPEVQPYYSRSRVAVCPLEVASGRQFKVIEAFAAGVPVVTTNVVAKNLAAVAGKDLLVGNHPQALADAIVSLLQNDRLAKELRSRARERALKEFDWAIAGKALLGVYGRR
jgi:glycosyltransferase involved in cell wall biosynthesis